MNGTKKSGRENSLQPLRSKQMKTVAQQVITQRFDFSVGSYLVERIVNQVFIAFNEYDQSQGIRRIQPHEVVVQHHGQHFVMPLLSSSIIDRLIKGESYANVRMELQEDLYRQILTVDPDIRFKDIRLMVAPWDLEMSRRIGGHRFKTPTAQESSSSQWIPTEDAFDFTRLKELVRLKGNMSPPLEHLPEVPQPLLDRLIPVITSEGRSLETAKILVQTLAHIRDQFCPCIENLSSGQTIGVAIAVTDRRLHTPTCDRKMVPVRLTIYTPQELETLKQQDSSTKETIDEVLMNRAARLLTEAYAQGGLLSLHQLSFLLQTSTSIVGKLIANFESKYQIILPTPGTIHDMGSKFSHKAIITRLHIEGLTAKEISHKTYHSCESISSYLRSFETLLILLAYDLPQALLPHIMRLGPSIVQQYLDLIKQYIGDKDAIIEHVKSNTNLTATESIA